MTPQRLAEIRARLAAATPGPWFTVDLPWRPRGCGSWIVAGNPDPHVGTPVLDSIDIEEWLADEDGPDYTQSDADLEFAAAARSDIPALLAEVDRLRGLLLSHRLDPDRCGHFLGGEQCALRPGHEEGCK